MGAYRSNRRRALVTYALVGLGTLLLGLSWLIFGLTNVTLASMLANQQVDTHNSLAQSVRSWEDHLALVAGVGILAKVLAGVALTLWLARSIANLRALPVPDARLPSRFLIAPLILLFPTLVWAFVWLRLTHPQAVALYVALAVAATLSLTLPLGVFRRLWVASSARDSTETLPRVWGGLMVWWVTYLAGWMAMAFHGALPEPSSTDAGRWADSGTAASYLMARGIFELAAATALVIAAIFFVRTIFRINAMQDGHARTAPEPTPSLER